MAGCQLQVKPPVLPSWGPRSVLREPSSARLPTCPAAGRGCCWRQCRRTRTPAERQVPPARRPGAPQVWAPRGSRTSPPRDAGSQRSLGYLQRESRTRHAYRPGPCPGRSGVASKHAGHRSNSNRGIEGPDSTRCGSLLPGTLPKDRTGRETHALRPARHAD